MFSKPFKVDTNNAPTGLVRDDVDRELPESNSRIKDKEDFDIPSILGIIDLNRLKINYNIFSRIKLFILNILN